MRPKISQEVIDRFTDMIDAQDAKGIEKYGRNIDQANDEDYDWRIMALEECADQLKYMAREIKMLDKSLKEERRKNIMLTSQINRFETITNSATPEMVAEMINGIDK